MKIEIIDSSGNVYNGSSFESLARKSSGVYLFWKKDKQSINKDTFLIKPNEYKWKKDIKFPHLSTDHQGAMWCFHVLPADPELAAKYPNLHFYTEYFSSKARQQCDRWSDADLDQLASGKNS